MCKIYLVVLLLFFFVCSYGYNTGLNYYYILTLKNGETYSGRIAEELPNGDLRFSTSYDINNNFPVSKTEIKHIALTSSYERLSSPHVGSIGLGIGIPYGIFGFNMNVYPLKFAALSGGIGWVPLMEHSAYSTGLRIYPLKTGRTWTPKVSVFYGTNRTVTKNIHRFINPSYPVPGLFIEIGQVISNKKRTGSLDFGFIIPIKYDIHNIEKSYIEQGYKTKHSQPMIVTLAYQRHF